MLIDLTRVYTCVCVDNATSPVALPVSFSKLARTSHGLITLNSMRQLPGNTLEILMTKLPKLHHILRNLPGNFFPGSPGPAHGESQNPQPHWDFLIFLVLISGTSDYIWLF